MAYLLEHLVHLIIPSNVNSTLKYIKQANMSCIDIVSEKLNYRLNL